MLLGYILFKIANVNLTYELRKYWQKSQIQAENSLFP